MRLLARHLEQLLAYHSWAYQRLLDSLQQVDDTAYHAPCGLFFSSLHGTLNHLAVADRIWLARVRQKPAPFDRLDAQAVADRRLLPMYLAEGIRAWQVVLARYDDDSLIQPLAYRNLRGEPQQRSLAEIITHVVNHGTHHRGQASAALSMMSLATPAMDFIYFQPESP